MDIHYGKTYKPIKCIVCFFVVRKSTQNSIIVLCLGELQGQKMRAFIHVVLENTQSRLQGQLQCILHPLGPR